MCGIAGILLHEGANTRHLSAIEPMLATLHHRGPDGKGIWLDRASGVALGHRRLAIVDLSEAGHQPMLSESENLVVTFNGEIYNFTALRPGLEAKGHRFRGTSDTEVMLAAFESYGIEEALKQFSGMFAAAIWDRKHRILHFVRDRMGKKPIYVALADGALLFASELKALLASPQFHPLVDTRALDAMLRRGWMPDQRCIWRNVFKLPPGTMLSIQAADLATANVESLRERSRRWWSLAAIAETGQRQQLELDDDALDTELDWLLRTAVRQRMVADVPLGAFLSGGIDSSTIVALMQAQSPRPVRTFTIGFHEAQYDEAAHASQVARHFGCEHTEFRLTPAEVCAVIPELPRIWDEPFADESQIPTLLVSRLARQHVTVALTGDGGDECFGGYARHFMLDRFAAFFELPASVRRLIASMLLKLSPQAWEQIVHALPFAAAPSSAASGANLQKFARALGAADDQERYDQLTTFGSSSVSLDSGVSNSADTPIAFDAVGKIIYRDMAGYLTGDILVKLDRATMAASLEGRCPFLDDRIVEFAWRLPTAAKIRNGRGKWPLRRILRRYLPESLFERPKQGFNVPIGEWLRGPLREWAQDLLDGDRIRRDGLLDSQRIRACWQQHFSRRADRSGELWAILMVQAWLDSIRDFRPPLPSFKSDETNTWAVPKAQSLISHDQGDRLCAYWPEDPARCPPTNDHTGLHRVDPAPAARLSHDMQRELR
jgi:asparagine synthase (glutamine-hydrolysing)